MSYRSTPVSQDHTSTCRSAGLVAHSEQGGVMNASKSTGVTLFSQSPSQISGSPGLENVRRLKAHEPPNYPCVSWIWARSVPGIAVSRSQECPLTWMPERCFSPGGSGVRSLPCPSHLPTQEQRSQRQATGPRINCQPTSRPASTDPVRRPRDGSSGSVALWLLEPSPRTAPLSPRLPLRLWPAGTQEPQFQFHLLVSPAPQAAPRVRVSSSTPPMRPRLSWVQPTGCTSDSPLGTSLLPHQTQVSRSPELLQSVSTDPRTHARPRAHAHLRHTHTRARNLS